MTNPLFLDHNALTYAWEAGGKTLLDQYATYAKSAGYELVVTDVVRAEIADGPKKSELGKWLDDNGVKPQATAEGTKYEEYRANKQAGLPTGNYDAANAGDRSISELAKTTKEAGASPRVFSDDGWFKNPQLLKQSGLTSDIGFGTADMLNHAAATGSMTPEDFTKYRDGYKTNVNPFKPGSGAYSSKLDRFITPEQLADVLKSGSSLTSTYLPMLGKGLTVLGVAGLIYDIGTSTADAAAAADAGNKAEAGNIMARLAGRLYAGLEAGAAGAALGGTLGTPGGLTAFAGAVVGGLLGGIAGAALGDIAADKLWQAADTAVELLKSVSSERGVDTPLLTPTGKVYRDLISSGMPKEQAQKMLDALNAEYRERRLKDTTTPADELVQGVIRDVVANQGVEPTGDNGLSITTIGGGKGNTTIVINDNGKVETTSDAITGKPTSSTRYDTRGIKFQDTKYNADGSRVENHFDTSNTQAWKQAEQRFGADGKLSYQQNTNRDGSRIEWAYSPQSGHATWERKVAPDGSRVDRNLDPDNKYAWSEGIYHYDAQNGLIHSTERSDDGTRWEKNFDPHNQYGWKQGTYQYNPQSQLTNSSEVSDDNSRTERTFNPQTGQATVADNFNSQGQHTYHSDINPDGSRSDYGIDPATGRILQVDRLNASNQLTNRSLFNADGSRVDTDLDPTNAASWARGEYTYNPSGQLIARDVTMDNGSRVHTDLDPSNAASWKEGVYEYNTDGKLWKRTVTMDDGQTQVEDYDPSNVGSWSKGEYRYNAGGQLTAVDVTMDDGTRVHNDLDATNSAAWLSGNYNYNASGILVRSIVTMDDNSYQIQERDSTQAVPWASRTYNYSSYGQLLTGTVVRDDGSRDEITYNHVDGKVTILRTYNAQGKKTFDSIDEYKKRREEASAKAFFDQLFANIQAQNQAANLALQTQGTPAPPPVIKPQVGPTPVVPLYTLKYNPTPEPVKTYYKDKPAATGGNGVVKVIWGENKNGHTGDYFRMDVYGDGSSSIHYGDGTILSYDSNGNTVSESTGNSTDIGTPSAPPIVLDLNGDGEIDLKPADLTKADDQTGPHFNWQGTDKSQQTAWVGPHDGFLTIDLGADGSSGADGKIDQVREIAFALWKSEDERVAELRQKGIIDDGRAVTDLEGLRYAFDTNKDNLLDANDTRWNEFRVWQDSNQNGISDPGELKTMSEAGIKLINLMPTADGAKLFSDGSAITGTSTAEMLDGSKMLVADTSLAYRPS